MSDGLNSPIREDVAGPSCKKFPLLHSGLQFKPVTRLGLVATIGARCKQIRGAPSLHVAHFFRKNGKLLYPKATR